MRQLSSTHSQLNPSCSLFNKQITLKWIIKYQQVQFSPCFFHRFSSLLKQQMWEFFWIYPSNVKAPFRKLASVEKVFIFHFFLSRLNLCLFKSFILFRKIYKNDIIWNESIRKSIYSWESYVTRSNYVYSAVWKHR